MKTKGSAEEMQRNRQPNCPDQVDLVFFLVAVFGFSAFGFKAGIENPEFRSLIVSPAVFLVLIFTIFWRLGSTIGTPHSFFSGKEDKLFLWILTVAAAIELTGGYLWLVRLSSQTQ